MIKKIRVFFTEQVIKKISDIDLIKLWERTWIYKLYYFFRYSLYGFFKNVWVFRKALWEFRWWNNHSTLNILKTALEQNSEGLKKWGIEVEESRNKKINKINRAIELINNKIEDNYIERAENELGELTGRMFDFEKRLDGLFMLVDNRTKTEKKHDSKVFKYVRELEEKEWVELWEIFRGQPMNEWNRISKRISVKENGSESGKTYDDWFDGSDMRGWWD